MEALNTQAISILKRYKSIALKDLLKRFKITGKKNKIEMAEAIASYIMNPENYNQIKTLPYEILTDLGSFLPDPLLECICESEFKADMVYCTVCTKKQHKECIINLMKMPRYACITCQIKMMNPKDEVLEFLVRPGLVSSDPLRPKVLIFDVSKNIQNEVFSSKNKCEIQVRCLKVDCPGYCISWPKQGQLIINQKTIQEFRETSNHGTKRKNTALDISAVLNYGPNEISLIKRNDASQYCLAVVKVYKNSNDKIYEKMCLNTLSNQESINIIKSRFLNENEVKSSSIIVNLLCPYTKLLIHTPARGKDCTHINCFDLRTYIERQEYENYYWKCPICKLPSYFVVVDKYFEEILKLSRNNNQELTSIQLFENGTYNIIFPSDEDNYPDIKQKYIDLGCPSKALKLQQNKVIFMNTNTSREVIQID